ncbi:MAG: glycosyltransferase N-terminal domain-containing protein [Gemmatimonadota bacterium]
MSTYGFYEIVVRVVRVLARAVAPFDGRVRHGLEVRRAAPSRLLEWSAASRNRSRPLFWLHAPSVGEALMAQAIIERVRAAVPDSQIAFTWFSLSAERVADRVGADVTACLPWDIRGDVRCALDALSPDVIGFVRTEIWPVLQREARRRGTLTALVNAPLAEGSSRLRPLARRFLAPAYGRLDAVGAVARADADRLLRLGVRSDRLRVTGDARVDQAVLRIEREPVPSALLDRLTEPGVAVVVAGSTWPADEDRLLHVMRALREDASRRVRWILAPHQPTAAHLRRLEDALRTAGLGGVRLAEVERGSAPGDVVLVDRVGVLADLYRIASVAWVGGGFGDRGLHSVLEPAALGVPAVYGPRLGSAREAESLADAGGGFVAADVAAMTERLRTLLDDGVAAARAARAWMASERGGAERNAALLIELLEGSGRASSGG